MIVTGDLHLNNLPRDQYRHDWQQQLRALAKKYKVPVLINGDLTDEKDNHPATLVNKVVTHIHELAQICTVIINKGNHDYTSLHTTPFFTFLNRLQNVLWINTPTWRADQLILPHSPNPERDWTNIDLKRTELIFAHQTFTGARSEHGRELQGVPKNLLPKGVPVVSGDVHTPQEDGSILYTGAPYTVDFGDDYAPRVLLIDGDNITSIPTTGPQKRLVEWKGKEFHKITGVNEGDIVKLRIEVDAAAYAHWGEIRDGAYAWAAKRGVTLHQIQPLAKKQTKTAKIERRKANKSDVEIIKGYVERKGVDAETLKIGQELL